MCTPNFRQQQVSGPSAQIGLCGCFIIVGKFHFPGQQFAFIYDRLLHSLPLVVRPSTTQFAFNCKLLYYYTVCLILKPTTTQFVFIFRLTTTQFVFNLRPLPSFSGQLLHSVPSIEGQLLHSLPLTCKANYYTDCRLAWSPDSESFLPPAFAAESTSRLCMRKKKKKKDKGGTGGGNGPGSGPAGGNCEATFLKKRRRAVKVAAETNKHVPASSAHLVLAKQLWVGAHSAERKFNRTKLHKKRCLANEMHMLMLTGRSP